MVALRCGRLGVASLFVELYNSVAAKLLVARFVPARRPLSPTEAVIYWYWIITSIWPLLIERVLWPIGGLEPK